MTHTDEIRGASNRIQARSIRRATLVEVLQNASYEARQLREDATIELATIDREDAVDGRILASTGAIIDGSRPERLFHRALKNLMQEWGITRDGVVAEILKNVKVDAEAVTTAWLNGPHMRSYVGKLVTDLVKKMAEPILHAEARAFLDRRVKLKVDVTAIVTPDVTLGDVKDPTGH